MKLTLRGKDPDMLPRDLTDEQRAAFLPFLEFAEYYCVEVDVDPTTGEGTCKFIPPKSKR